MNELMYYILLAVYGIFFIVVGGLCLADYILSALGLMRLARRRGIPNPWLSWIPVANIWLAGSLVDEYDLRQGKITRWRTALTALMALTLVLIVLYIVELLKMAIIADDTYYAENLGLALRALVIAIAMAGASTATKGCTMVCLYKVYESTVPEKALKYFLISLLVPLGQPICLYRCSNQGYNCTEEDDEEIMVEVFEIPAETTEE